MYHTKSVQTVVPLNSVSSPYWESIAH